MPNPIPQHIALMMDLKERGRETRLNLGRITDSLTLPDFATLRRTVTEDLRGEPGLPKMQHYGWIQSLFHPVKHPKYGGFGPWRVAIAERDELTAIVCDIDNEHEDRATIAWDDVPRNFAAHDLNPSMFGYDSFSAKPSAPRFRLVIEPDRAFTRVEARALNGWLDKHVLGGQADPTMADRAHYTIAPDHKATVYQQDGAPLPIDTILQAVEQEIVENCELLARTARSRRQSLKTHGQQQHRLTTREPRLSDEQFSAEMSPQIGDQTVLHWLTARDLEDYQSPHWRQMFVLLNRAWYRAGGTLTRGDMQALAATIDLSAGCYFIQKYGYAALNRRIDDVMATPNTHRDGWRVDA